MAGPLTRTYYSHHGTIHYTAHLHNNDEVASLPSPPCQPRRLRPHSIHISRLPAGFVPIDLRPHPPPKSPKKSSRFNLELRKLASREGAKRVLGSVFPSFSTSTSSSSSPALTPTSANSTTPSVTPSPAPTRTTSPERARPRPRPVSYTPGSSNTIFARRQEARRSVVIDPVMSRPSLAENSGNFSRDSINTAKSAIDAANNENEKPIAVGNGLACYIVLAEPVIYLTGHNHGSHPEAPSTSSSALLRGKLRLNVTKSAKIKAITLTFSGRGRTEWPEGIPPEKATNFEEESLRTNVLPFFNALYEGAESSYGTLCNYTFTRDKSATSSVTNLAESPSQSAFSLQGITNRSSRSSTLLSVKDQKRLALGAVQSRSYQKGDSPYGPTPQQKGYKLFHPGVYEYSFELTIDNNMPESTELQFAHVIWSLEAMVERAGTFKSNLLGQRIVNVVRSPSADSLELVEPISITRTWEDQLHYEIMISGKSFPKGSKIPVALKLTPLAKVQIHKIKVYVSENIEYYARNKHVHRRDITRKILVFEKTAGQPLAPQYDGSIYSVHNGELSPEKREERRAMARARRQWEAARRGAEPAPLPIPSENMLGDIDLGVDEWIGQTEIEIEAQLPTCETIRQDRSKRLHPACTWKNAEVHHWIRIVLRISRADPDPENPLKRRHFEISIDSPISILDCRATSANLALPAYSNLNGEAQNMQRVCGCPNAAAASSGSPGSFPGAVSTANPSPEPAPEIAMPNLTRPPQAHLSTNAASGVQRPIHMLRNPSFNPPPFDADEPPPPIATPPPNYDHVVGTPSFNGLADYFSRRDQEDDNSDDESPNRITNRGRVNVANPRTPGGRLARSMDIDRNFMFNTDMVNNALRLETAGGSDGS